MAERIVYFVSGHGYGHARRSAETISAIHRLRPSADVHIRTTAPRHIFERFEGAQYSTSQLDAGMAEIDALTIDVPRTLERLEQLVERREQIIAAEIEAIAPLNPSLIVSDVPFLAGHVAQRLGIACLLVSNFTWDWICDPLFAGSSEYDRRWAPVREIIRDGYAKMHLALRLPFGELSDALPRVVPVPLVASRAILTPAQTLRRAGLSSSDDRPRVLVSIRGGMPDELIARAAAEARDFQFLIPGAEASFPGGWPENVRPVTLDRGLDFSDVLAISRIALSKLGYGTVSECIAAGVRIVWPRRVGFREDDSVIGELPRYLPTAEISRADFWGGRWAVSLRRVLAQPPAAEAMRSDGAEVCAAMIVEILEGKGFCSQV